MIDVNRDRGGLATPYRLGNHPGLYYESMLADRLRMQRYRAAINTVVGQGDVVADLGTGLGVLAIMAAQAGAARVYAVESRPNVLPLAEHLLSLNGVADRVTLVPGDVRETHLPEPVDVLVNELIGDFGTDENIHACVGAFAANNLKPGGRLLPVRLRTLLAPVQYGDEFRGIWREDFEGLDLTPVASLPAEPEAVMLNLRENPLLLAQPALLEDIDFRSIPADRANAYPAKFKIEKPGSLQGFMGWFEAELAPGITLANHPVYPACHWQTWHWPVQPAQSVNPGLGFRVRLRTPEAPSAASWSLAWEREEDSE